MGMQGGAGSTGPQSALPGARSALILLLAINLFNYIDRQVLAAVLPKIRIAYLQDDPDASAKLGALTLAFIISYMVFSPVFGWLGDRTSRWLLVAVGVILWSLASGASGLAQSFAILFATRCFVGIGEAAYGPVAPTIISDLYPVKIRGSVLAWFYAAIPVGGALGYVLGGLLADSALGWRWAFYLVVPPGLLLGVLCFFMREPVRGQAEPGADGAPLKPGLREYRMLARTPSYVFNTLGMTAMTFAVGGIAAWMPTYIFNREARFQVTQEVVQQLSTARTSSSLAGDEPLPAAVLEKLNRLETRTFGLKEFQAEVRQLLSEEEGRKYSERIFDDCCVSGRLGPINTIFGGIVVLSGLIATLVGGWAGDVLRARYSGSYFLVSGISMILAFPMILLVLWTPFPLAWLFVFMSVFCLFFNTGPTNTILANVTHPAIRSTAFALNIFIIHAFGDAISPVIMGWIDDRLNLDVAMMCVSAVVLIGGVLWLLGIPHLERDTALAPTRLSMPARDE
jgi:MFS family permease